MPAWSNKPPDTRREFSLPLVRTPRGKALVAAATTEHLIGCYTHFFGGRTIPCEDPSCIACKEGMPYRWHGYIGAYDFLNSRQFIFEVTAAGADFFMHYFNCMHTLRGCLFRAQRVSAAANARCTIECKPADLSKIILPDPPDIIKCLSVIWQLPASAFHPEGGKNTIPQIHTDNDITSHVTSANAEDVSYVRSKPHF